MNNKYLHYNPITKKPYEGKNITILTQNQKAEAFKDNEWATYLQWIEAKRHVRKGEKGCKIIRNTGNIEKEKQFRKYTVFNKQQTTELK